MDDRTTEQPQAGDVISTTLPVTVYIRPKDKSADWQELDEGPGIIHIPPGHEAGVRIKGIDDRTLKLLAKELSGVESLVWLNLSENRNVTSEGLPALAVLTQLRILNLSSCAVTSTGLSHLKSLTRLEDLDLSYCNRITDDGLKALKPLARLERLNLQGCVKVTGGGVARLKRRGLEIHK